jgi:hypothetical protein
MWRCPNIQKKRKSRPYFTGRSGCGILNPNFDDTPASTNRRLHPSDIEIIDIEPSPVISKPPPPPAKRRGQATHYADPRPPKKATLVPWQPFILLLVLPTFIGMNLRMGKAIGARQQTNGPSTKITARYIVARPLRINFISHSPPGETRQPKKVITSGCLWRMEPRAHKPDEIDAEGYRSLRRC